MASSSKWQEGIECCREFGSPKGEEIGGPNLGPAICFRGFCWGCFLFFLLGKCQCWGGLTRFTQFKRWGDYFFASYAAATPNENKWVTNWGGISPLFRLCFEKKYSNNFKIRPDDGNHEAKPKVGRDLE